MTRASRSMRAAAAGSAAPVLDDLERDPAPEHAVFREVDRAHAAPADLFEKAVLGLGEVGPLGDVLQMRDGPVGKPPHSETPRRLRASSRNSRSVAVISRSFSRTMRRNSRRAWARKFVTCVAGIWNSSASLS